MTDIISFLIQWVVSPCIMLGLFLFSMCIVSTTKKTELKVSAQAGGWAGILIFIVYLIYQLDAIQYPELDYNILPNPLITPIAFGFISGFILLLLVRLLIFTRFVGIITLILTSASTSSLFTYFLIEKYRLNIFYCSLGLALGMLLNMVLFPHFVKAIFEGKKSSK